LGYFVHQGLATVLCSAKCEWPQAAGELLTYSDNQLLTVFSLRSVMSEDGQVRGETKKVFYSSDETHQSELGNG